MLTKILKNAVIKWFEHVMIQKKHPAFWLGKLNLSTIQLFKHVSEEMDKGQTDRIYLDFWKAFAKVLIWGY